MERLLYVSSTVVLLFISLILISWYGHIDNYNIVDSEDKHYMSTGEAERKLSDPVDSSKDYYYIDYKTTKTERTNIPLVYKTTIIEGPTRKYYSR